MSRPVRASVEDSTTAAFSLEANPELSLMTAWSQTPAIDSKAAPKHRSGFRPTIKWATMPGEDGMSDHLGEAQGDLLVRLAAKGVTRASL
ncbi:MAG: hypothetical protein JO195_07680 [Candidatus Eremiobacteraeota bacterium]|nr:hypothetical protein [Candidatus Eremiobacteraeota bacterium]